MCSSVSPLRIGLACLLLGLLALLPPVQAQTPLNPEGSWQGTLEAGAARLRLMLTFTRSASGDYTAVMESIDQGSTIPGDKVTISGDKIRVDFERVNGFYEGSINKDSSEIDGTWTQSNIPRPLIFTRALAGAPAKEDTKPASDEKPFTPPIDVVVPVAPIAFQAEGKTHLAYELHITNFSVKSVTLARVEVLSDAGRSLAKMAQADLLASVLLIGDYQAAGMDKLTFGPGQMINVYVWVTLETSAVPAAVQHKITVKTGKNQDEITAQGVSITVGHDLATLAAPLRGDNWVAANGPSNTSGHRRALIPVDGRAQIAQRFAIDWVRVNADGKTFTGDPKDNKNYRGYGVGALAVADGIVTEVKDGIPENVPGIDSRAVPITLETIGGNHVVLDIGHGRYAFYAHLQPGSLKVKLGDHVKRGQALGLVGNSGNSTEPHLHFHLSNGNSPLGSEGIPYALESFDARTKKDSAVTHHKMEIPTEGEIVIFAER